MKPEIATPTVSIIICAYNAAPYIADTLDSVFAQTFHDYEIIVVNDGSTDDTEELLAPYLHRIKYLTQKNAGPAAARNTAMREAGGKYIALLDSDDQWMPNYLEKMLAQLEADPIIDVLYPNAMLFGAPHWEGQLFQDVCPSTAPITLEKVLTRESNIFISAVFKRAILGQVGVFDEDLCGSEDFDLWVRMLLHGFRFAFTTEVLARYRKRKDSLSSGSVKYYENAMQAYRKIFDEPTLTAAQRKLIEVEVTKIETEIHLIRSKQKIAGREFLVAARHLLEVHAHRPSIKLKLVLASLILFPDLLFWFVTKREANVSISIADAQLPHSVALPEPQSLPQLVTKPTSE